jgi:dolichyl-phosphate-mannose-protein mannosyltransferase
MANRTTSNAHLVEKKDARRPKSRSPAPQSRRQPAQKVASYTSEGVTDHDIFNLPGSDWQLLGFLTFLAALVRLFRIYQPSSVVFDEVQ